MDFDILSVQKDPEDDQQDGPARYALYDTRRSTDLLANKQENDLLSEENNYLYPG